MPGWFDLTGLTFSEKMVEDEKGMLSTVSTGKRSSPVGVGL